MTALDGDAPVKTGVKRLWRLVVVALAALLAFAGALVHYKAPPAGACVATATHDPAYQAHFEEPLSMANNVFHLDVTHDGQPVTGAKVCVATAMVGMSAMGASRSAKEVSPGRYEVFINFQMDGGFDANVGITEAGKPPVVVHNVVSVNG